MKRPNRTRQRPKRAVAKLRESFESMAKGAPTEQVAMARGASELKLSGDVVVAVLEDPTERRVARDLCEHRSDWAR